MFYTLLFTVEKSGIPSLRYRSRGKIRPFTLAQLPEALVSDPVRSGVQLLALAISLF